jgi:hypothetical protein
MGTRIDFWIGIDKGAEWIGSVGWDGFKEDLSSLITDAMDAEVFRHHVLAHIRAEDGITPADGWQWPWRDSRTSDNSVWFHNGIVYFEADDHLVPFSQIGTYNGDDVVKPRDLPGVILPNWNAMPDMRDSPNALYPNDRSKRRGRDKGAGPMIIIAR